VNYKGFKMADLDPLSPIYYLETTLFSLLAVIEEVLRLCKVPWRSSVMVQDRR
jgi:hypothetical protein